MSVIPNGTYTLKWGESPAPGGLYVTASIELGRDVRAEAQIPIPPTKTQHVGSICILLI
jgi:hypothetical protein